MPYQIINFFLISFIKIEGSMSIRKNRIPLQGISNLRATEADWKTKTNNVWNPIEKFKVKNN